MWVCAMHRFGLVQKEVMPKKLKLVCPPTQVIAHVFSEVFESWSRLKDLLQFLICDMTVIFGYRLQTTFSISGQVTRRARQKGEDAERC